VLEKSKEKIDMKENIDQQSTKIPKDVRNAVGSPTPSTPILQNKAYLLHALLMLYSHIIGVYLIAALFTWPSKIKDKEDLNKLNTLIFSDIKEIQSKLSDVLPKIDGNADDDNPLINIMLDGLYGLYPHALTYVTNAFENYGLKKELEPIMELLLKTTFDLLPHQTLTNFLKYTSPGRTPIQNWRDYIEVVKRTSNLQATLKGVLKGHLASLKKS
jgi:hypothetical protein